MNLKNNGYSAILFVLLYLLTLASHAADFTLVSPAFGHSGNIPQQFTCNGEGISPPLYWLNPPENTVSFVLLVDDVDAPSGDWVHWLLFDIPANVRSLSEAIGLPKYAISGQNSWGETGYRGPCPPNGKHHYFFRIYALDTLLNLSPQSKKQDVIKAMEGHVLETSELVGMYGKE